MLISCALSHKKAKKAWHNKAMYQADHYEITFMTLYTSSGGLAEYAK